MIDSYSFGSMIINGQEYRSDIIVLPGSIVADWRRQNGHLLLFTDIEEYFEVLPNVLVVGTGRFGMMRVDQDLREIFRSQNKSVVAERTHAAWKTFNRYLDAGISEVGAFHLTC